MTATKTQTRPTMDDLRHAMEAAQAAFAEAEAAEARQAQAAKLASITTTLDDITKATQTARDAVGNGDTAALRQAVADIISAAKGIVAEVGKAKTPRTSSGTRTTHDGPKLADLVMDYLTTTPGPATPGTIAKALDRSSGAVSAAIERPNTGLLATAKVTQTSTAPKMFAAV